MYNLLVILFENQAKLKISYDYLTIILTFTKRSTPNINTKKKKRIFLQTNTHMFSYTLLCPIL